MGSPNDNGGGGYINLHRCLQSHWITARAEYVAAWIDLLMLVNWRDRRELTSSGVVTVPRGSCLASERFLQKRWKRWGFRSRMMIRTFLRRLEEDGMICRKESSPHDTLVTVCNYETYQVGAASDSPHKAHAKPTSSPQVAQREEGKEGKKVEEQQQPLVGLAADRAPTQTRKPDLLWEALMAVCGINGNITKSARGAYNKARSELAAVDATPDEVRKRAATFRRQWPTVSLTPSALAKQWAQLETPHVDGARATTKRGETHHLGGADWLTDEIEERERRAAELDQ